MERDYHSTSCKVQFTGKLVNGKIKANKRSQLPISDFSIPILFPPSLHVCCLYTERAHQDCVGMLADLHGDLTSILWRTIKDAFYHSNHWFNITEVTWPIYPTQEYVPHPHRRPAPTHQALHKKPENCGEKQTLNWLKPPGAGRDPLTHRDGNKEGHWAHLGGALVFTLHSPSPQLLQKNRGLGIASSKTYNHSFKNHCIL